MLKNIIAPVQAWLLSQGRCVGCGTPLKEAVRETRKKGEVLVCKCKRIYIKDEDKKAYRRALLTEV